MIGKVRKHVKKHIDNHINELKKAEIKPHSIALGFAIGTFLSVVAPFINFWIAIALIIFFKQINKYSLFAALLLWNPLTLIPIYAMNYAVGNFLFGNSPIIEFEAMLLNYAYEFIRNFFAGGIVVAIPLSILSYILVKFLVILYLKTKSGPKQQEQVK
ncbi:TPA: DUF2062 domain-containing protein [Candidatus Woesearchaeota archaeon]|nr:hypothetical protein QT06_C0001G0955 [archaeon GW2011_AR15]MBS3104569.1 DUF2062 domain-containing protein [Candidatus Woesearchaeota archaeon]HIH41116.1 DUF2062 domain-containing protein [Candidatus Woesearchaeota archaeon]